MTWSFICGNMRSRCVRIANEILMHFRTVRRLSSEVSLSESIDTDKEGNSLALMDVISADNTLLERVEIIWIWRKSYIIW